MLLFRAVSETNVEEDAYVKAASERGIAAQTVGVVQTRLVDGAAEQLTRCLTEKRWSAIVLTSHRAAQVFVVAASAGGVAPPVRVYVVGERTWRTVERGVSGQWDVRGRETGNAAQLAELIKEEHSAAMRGARDERGERGEMLFVCGDSRRDVLPCALERASIPLTELIVYRSERIPLAQVEATLLRVPFTPAWRICFSPQCAQVAATAHVDKGGAWIAIGESTATQMRSLGLTVAATCARPTPQHLLDLILQQQQY